MAPSPRIDAEANLENAGQMISSSGLVHQWRSVFNVHVTEIDEVPWCLCRRHLIVKHEEEPKQGAVSRRSHYCFGEKFQTLTQSTFV